MTQEKEHSSHPLNLIGRLGLNIYGGLYINHGQYNVCAEKQPEFDALKEAIANGEPYSLERMGDKLYDVALETKGLGNIPTVLKAGESLILALNHYNEGVNRGNWSVPVLVKLVRQHMASEDGNALPMAAVFTNSKGFVDDAKMWANVIDEKLTPIFRGKRPLQAITTPAIEYVRRNVDHALANARQTMGGLISSEDRRGIMSFLREGGILFICPSADDERELKQGDPRAGALLEWGARNEIEAAAVGIWHDPILNQYYANFGHPKLYPKDRSNPDSVQATVDSMGREIASLIPPPYRGYYDGARPFYRDQAIKQPVNEESLIIYDAYDAVAVGD